MEMSKSQFEGIVNRVAQNFVDSRKDRVVNGYLIELERISAEDAEILGVDALEVKTWGYDAALIALPKTWEDMTRARVMTQIRMMESKGMFHPLDVIEYRLYVNIMRAAV